jgi:hypothetical protein
MLVPKNLVLETTIFRAAKLGQNERVQRAKRLYAKGLIEYLTM